MARPDALPYVLEGHSSEVTGAAWCASEPNTVATCSDDCSLRVWKVDRTEWPLKPRQPVWVSWLQLAMSMPGACSAQSAQRFACKLTVKFLLRPGQAGFGQQSHRGGGACLPAPTTMFTGA